MKTQILKLAKYLLPLVFLVLSQKLFSQPHICIDDKTEAGNLNLYRGIENKINDYYYIPNKLQLATTDDEKPMFLFQWYVKNVRSEGEKEITEGEGGGIVTFVVELKMADEEIEEAKQELRRINPKGIWKGALPFTAGTSELIYQPNDAEKQKVIGAGPAPLMEGDRLAMTFQLDKDNAKLLYESFKSSTSPINVRLKLTAIGYSSPLEFNLNINWEKVYQHKIFNMAAATPIFSGEINTAIQELRETQAIKVTNIGENANMQRMQDIIFNKIVEQCLVPFGSEGDVNWDDLAKPSYNGGRSYLDKATEALNGERANVQVQNDRIRQENREERRYAQDENRRLRKENSQNDHQATSPTGNTANTTTTGTNGSTGTTGNTRNTGTIGNTGATINTGTTSNTGTTGTIGNTGTTGNTGSTGTTGNTSTTGNSGATGITGHASTTGNTGTTGTTGHTRTTGNTGTTGTTGNTSTTGNIGTSGTTGNARTTGTTENTGTNGSTSATSAATRPDVSMQNNPPPQIGEVLRNISPSDVPSSNSSAGSVAAPDYNAQIREEEAKPVLKVMASYSKSKKSHTGSLNVEQKQYMTTSQLFPVDGNLGKINCASCIQKINLWDALYQQRELVAFIDGANSDDFGKFINFVTVTMRKKHPKGDITTDEVRIDRKNFNKQGNNFKLLYGWMPGDDDRKSWLNYEYKTSWSFFGGGSIENDWTPSDQQVINLSAPLQRRIVNIVADPDKLKDENIRSVTVRIFYKLGDQEQVKQSTLNPLKGITNCTIEFMLPKNVIEYSYEVDWLLNNNEVKSSMRRNSKFDDLYVDNITN